MGLLSISLEVDSPTICVDFFVQVSGLQLFGFHPVGGFLVSHDANSEIVVVIIAIIRKVCSIPYSGIRIFAFKGAQITADKPMPVTEIAIANPGKSGNHFLAGGIAQAYPIPPAVPPIKP